jgi:penicillin-binding protein 2
MAVDKRAARLGALALVSVILLGAIGARLWFLQTVQRDSLQEQVLSSQRRSQMIPAERGRIFDAQSRILADNRRVITVTVDRAVIRKSSNRLTLFSRLSGILNVPVETMEARWKSGRYSQYLPLPVAEDVPEDVVLRIESRSEDYPGVHGDEDWARVYPYAPLASHVVGYMGLILKEQEAQYKALGYQSNETVGQFGVEKSMESVLHGTPGEVVYEVDSANRVVREVSRIDPVPGKDVQLTIDLKVQQYTERLLETQLRNRRQHDDISQMAKNPIIKDPLDGEFKPKFQNENWYVDEKGDQYLPYPAPAGSMVVEDYKTGQIVAMASYPTFDNRWFTINLTGAKFKQLFPNDQNPDRSILVNRAIQGQYNMGSTFKPFVAYAALMKGLITKDEIFTDTGSYTLNIDKSICDTGVRCEYFNAISSGFGKPSEYGPVTVEDALAVSSDSFFYHIGELAHEADASRNLLGNEVRLFGFGSDTGIDLPYEFDGRIPTSALKKQLIESGALSKNESPNLLLGDNVQLAIGQGLLAASPLQLANAYSTMANSGFLLRPHIVRAIWQPGVPDGYPGYGDFSHATLVASFDKPEVKQQIEWPNEVAQPIVRGLERVIQGPGVTFKGVDHNTTGWSVFLNYPYGDLNIAGKTGTAQGAQSKPWFDSSVFAGFSINNPAKTYTVVSYLEKAGYGSKASAPAVKCMFEALGGSIAMDEVQLSDPLDPSSLEPAPSNTLIDSSCLAGRFDNIRD